LFSAGSHAQAELQELRFRYLIKEYWNKVTPPLNFTENDVSEHSMF
jgi:hypothetical protein